MERIRHPEEPGRGRSVAAGILGVLGCLLSVVSLVAVWVHGVVADTDRFADTTSPLIQQRSVQTLLTNQLTQTVMSAVDVPALAEQAAGSTLPAELADQFSGLSGSGMTERVREFVQHQIDGVVTSPAAATIWDQLIRAVHEQVTAVLSAPDQALPIDNGKIVLDLKPLLVNANAELTRLGLPEVNDPATSAHATITIGDATALIQARTAYQLLDTSAAWLPWLTVALLAIGVLLAVRRRRALLRTGVGVAVGVVVLAAGLIVARVVLLGTVPAGYTAPAGDSYDVITGFLRGSLWVVGVVALLVIVGALLAGSSRVAARVQRLRSGLGRVDSSGPSAHQIP